MDAAAMQDFAATHGRAQAALAAAVMGDALARPFAGMKFGHVQQLLGNPAEGFLDGHVLFPEKPERNVLPGLHGAGAQRLLASLAVLKDDDLGRAPIARVGARMLELSGDAEDEGFRWGAWRHPGRPLRHGLVRWKANFPWETTEYFAEAEQSEGFGGALCGLTAAVAGLPQADIIGLARLTHTRVISQVAVIAVAILTELLIAGTEPVEALRALIARLEPIEVDLEKEWTRAYRELAWGKPNARLTRALAPLPSLLREASDDLAIATIVRTAQEFPPAAPVTHVQHGFPAACLPWAIYRAFGPMPARRAVEDVMNRGGEAPTVAALVCAFEVLRHGPACLPDEWWEGTLALPLVTELLADSSPANLDRWSAQEASWTEREEALRVPLREAIERQARADAAKGKLEKKPKKSAAEEQAEATFAPPPHLWIKPGDEEDPRVKRLIKEARGKKKIDWKEDRRQKGRDQD